MRLFLPNGYKRNHDLRTYHFLVFILFNKIRKEDKGNKFLNGFPPPLSPLLTFTKRWLVTLNYRKQSQGLLGKADPAVAIKQNGSASPTGRTSS